MAVFVEMYNADREFHLLIEFLNKHAEPKGTVDEAVPSPSPSQTEQEAAPTPTPTLTADRLIVQTPRSNANPSGTVVSLDAQTFDNFLTQGPAFVKFFAPWCGHCKKLAPTWIQLGRHMQHTLNIAEVDCEQHKALCTSQSVTGFPMMFYYANGVKTEYSGGRSYDQLVSFAEKASNPNMQVIDASELDRVVREQAVFYLLLHNGSDPHIVTDIAKASSVLLGSPPIYVSTAAALFQKYVPSSTSSALLAFKDHDAREPVSVFYPIPPPASSAALVQWLHTHRFSSSFELSKDVFQQVMYAPHNPLVVIVATPDSHRGTVPPKLADIAQKWRLRKSATGREVVFTWMDAGTWGKWLKDMYGVKPGTAPAIVVADHERLVYYDRDAAGHEIAFNSVSIASALDAILTGKANPRQSRTVVERVVHSLTGALVRLEASVVAHPYMTAADHPRTHWRSCAGTSDGIDGRPCRLGGRATARQGRSYRLTSYLYML
ncbi:hypothetical protein JVU11DRAFT_1200 [Chiua virens]|nr:hypothetical protein JVU11DRAFT_1200 [Chiua virens]